MVLASICSVYRASMNEQQRTGQAFLVRFFLQVLASVLAVFVTQLCLNLLVNILNLLTIRISLILGRNWLK
jgi:hypothetical protein